MFAIKKKSHMHTPNKTWILFYLPFTVIYIYIFFFSTLFLFLFIFLFSYSQTRWMSANINTEHRSIHVVNGRSFTRSVFCSFRNVWGACWLLLPCTQIVGGVLFYVHTHIHIHRHTSTMENLFTFTSLDANVRPIALHCIHFSSSDFLPNLVPISIRHCLKFQFNLFSLSAVYLFFFSLFVCFYLK